MLNNNKIIDLSYFLSSLKLRENLSKSEFLKTIEADPSCNFTSLLDLYKFAAIKYESVVQRLNIFADNGGSQKGIPFPDLNQLELATIKFYRLFNYAVKDVIGHTLNEIKHSTEANLALVYFEGKLSLAYKNSKGGLDKTRTPISVDYLEGKTGYRLNDKRVLSEAVVKATLSKKLPAEQQVILDCTGGFGQDALLLSKAGASVLILERNPLIALLLADGLTRLQASQEQELNISLMFPVSITDKLVKKHFVAAKLYFNSVYLDPMYPHTSSTAKVNKNMQLIQEVVGSDTDADELLVAAQELNAHRIVVKRPANAPFLNNQETKDAVKTTAHRFDQYLVGKPVPTVEPSFAKYKFNNRITAQLDDLEFKKKLAKLAEASIDNLFYSRQLTFNESLRLSAINQSNEHIGVYPGFSLYLGKEVVLPRIQSDKEFKDLQDQLSTIGEKAFYQTSKLEVLKRKISFRIAKNEDVSDLEQEVNKLQTEVAETKTAKKAKATTSKASKTSASKTTKSGTAKTAKTKSATDKATKEAKASKTNKATKASKSVVAKVEAEQVEEPAKPKATRKKKAEVEAAVEVEPKAKKSTNKTSAKVAEEAKVEEKKTSKAKTVKTKKAEVEAEVSDVVETKAKKSTKKTSAKVAEAEKVEVKKTTKAKSTKAKKVEVEVVEEVDTKVKKSTKKNTAKAAEEAKVEAKKTTKAKTTKTKKVEAEATAKVESKAKKSSKKTQATDEIVTTKVKKTATKKSAK